MTSIPYWPTTLPQSPISAFEGGPVDYRDVFQPDRGGPITRPRGTGAISRYSVPFIFTLAQLATFETWHTTTLGQGSARFIMRTKPQNDVRWWKFAAADSAYKIQYPGPEVVRVSMQLVRYPHTPWFAQYVMSDSSWSPAWVADYDNGIYGIGADKVAASELTTIAGTYYVVRNTTSGTTEGEEVLAAGDIPATAPAGTRSIIGYDPVNTIIINTHLTISY